MTPVKHPEIRKALGAGALSAAMILGALSAPGALAAPASTHAHHDHAPAPIAMTDTAYLLIAPDRGFLGNVELQDAFEGFTQGRSGKLVYVTDDRTQQAVKDAVSGLVKGGAKRIVVLPFFLSDDDPAYLRVQAILRDRGVQAGASITWSRPFGDSYLAVEMLADRFKGIADPAGRRVVVVGSGAVDAKSRKAMQADWERMAQAAAEGLGFESVRVIVSDPRESIKNELENAVKGGKRPVVVPFHLGKKLDGMMSYDAFLQGMMPKDAAWLGGDLATHAAMPLWFEREANRQATLRPEEIGVILLAHGSDHHWNDTMIGAISSLTTRYMIEPALSMADPQVVERAVRRLEKRGAKGIVIVRVFGSSDSFKADVERMIGFDVEEAARHHAMGHHVGGGSHAGHGGTHGAHGGHGGHGHGHGGPMTPQRIRTAAVMTTLGGLDAHPLFAEALLDRANALSKNPKQETVILVAHGVESDKVNSEWQDNLKEIAETMRARGGSKFRSILTATWREDWPDKREPSIARVRQFVQDAGKDGGRAIVIPARTTARGPEKELLDGLSFEHGSGFAPHPKFVQWFEEQIKTGSAALSPQAAASSHHGH
jgi:sirohydrochlorin ferrochelatase